MSKSEAAIQTEVMVEISKRGIRGWKNTSGVFHTDDGRIIRAGLGNVSAKINQVMKSSDIIACVPTLITPEMVGTTVGVFCSIEVKKESWKRNTNDSHQNAQDNWLNMIRNLGGIAGFISNINQLDELLNNRSNKCG